MRSAVSRFIECISIAHISLTEKIRRSLLDTLNENLKHPNSQIQVFSSINYTCSCRQFLYACILISNLFMPSECCCRSPKKLHSHLSCIGGKQGSQ